MKENEVLLKCPIEVIDYNGDNYYLIIKDAEGVQHYFHKEHENKFGKFIQGEYDGYSREIEDRICRKNH